jgi:hypothetical protein
VNNGIHYEGILSFINVRFYNNHAALHGFSQDYIGFSIAFPATSIMFDIFDVHKLPLFLKS